MRDQVRFFGFVLERTQKVFHLLIFFCLLDCSALVDFLLAFFNLAFMLAQRLFKAASILALKVALFFEKLLCLGQLFRFQLLLPFLVNEVERFRFMDLLPSFIMLRYLRMSFFAPELYLFKLGLVSLKLFFL